MSQNYKGIPDEDVERLLQKLEYNAAKGLVSDFATVISLRGYMHRCIQRCSTISSLSSLPSKSSDPAQPTRRTLPMNDEWMMNDEWCDTTPRRLPHALLGGLGFGAESCIPCSLSRWRTPPHIQCKEKQKCWIECSSHERTAWATLEQTSDQWRQRCLCRSGNVVCFDGCASLSPKSPSSKRNPCIVLSYTHILLGGGKGARMSASVPKAWPVSVSEMSEGSAEPC